MVHLVLQAPWDREDQVHRVHLAIRVYQVIQFLLVVPFHHVYHEGRLVQVRLLDLLVLVGRLLLVFQEFLVVPLDPVVLVVLAVL